MNTARKHFDELLTDLKAQVMEMGSRAERMVADAVDALVHLDSSKAYEVIDLDSVLDRMELEIQSTSLIIIAREAPVARDVRFLSSATSVSSELERVGDDAVSIAKKAISFPDDVFPREYSEDLLDMSEKVRTMLLNSLRAFSDENVDLLEKVIASDAEVDNIWKRVRRRLKDDIRENPEFLNAGFKLIQAFHHLEYVGDKAVSVAEKLEFVRTGNLMRFSRAKF